MKMIDRLLLIATRKLKPQNIQFKKHYVCTEDYFKTNRIRGYGYYAMASAMFLPVTAYVQAELNKQVFHYYPSAIISSLCLLVFIFSRKVVYFSADHWGVYINGKKSSSWENVEIESQSSWLQRLIVNVNGKKSNYYVCCGYLKLLQAKEGSSSIKKKWNNSAADINARMVFYI